MSYIDKIKDFWRLHEQEEFQPNDIALYFYLLELNNKLSWIPSFKRNNSKIQSDLRISFFSLSNSRNKLKQAGLIQFKTQNGSSNVTYNLSQTSQYSLEVAKEVAKEVTSVVTNEVTNELKKTKTKTKTKTKEKEEEKVFVRELVSLTPSEILKLKTKYSEIDYEWLLDKLFNHKASRGVEYKSDYHAIAGWVKDALEEKKRKEKVISYTKIDKKTNEFLNPRSDYNPGKLY